MLNPRILINLVCIAVVAIALAMVWLIRAQPYLGFSLAADSEGVLRVSAVQPWVAAAGLHRGDRIVSIRGADGRGFVPHRRHFPVSTLDRRQHYANKVQRFTEQAMLYRVLGQPRVSITLDSGRSLELTLNQPRPLTDIGFDSWMRLAMGLLALLLGALVWAWRPLRRDTFYLMLSGASLCLVAMPSMVYVLDMYILHPVLVWCLSYATGLGNIGFVTFGPLVLLYYPQRLPRAHQWNRAVVAAALVYAFYSVLNTWDPAANFTDQALYISDAEIYGPIPLSYLLIQFFCYRQWRLSRERPLERARALWIILCWTAGPTLFMVLYLLPVVLGLEPLLGRTWAFAAITLAYLMVVLGVGRLRLFNLESHVATAWRWFLVTAVFICCDIALIAWVNLDPKTSTLILLFVLLWGYLPLRHWLYIRLGGSRSRNYRRLLTTAIGDLAKGSLVRHTDARLIWRDTLQRIFSPVTIRWCDGEQESQIRERGQALLVGNNRLTPALYMDFADNGSRLFRREDRDLVQSLQLVFERLYDFQTAFVAGQTRERERIRRDLHDQIGHNLLSLIYAAPEPASRKLAQDTMEQLREVIRALRDEPVRLAALVAELRQLAEEACQRTGLHLDWRDRTGGDEQLLATHHYLNIINIVRELLNNTIKHAGASEVGVSLSVAAENSPDRSVFVLALRDNGRGFDPDNIRRGNGLFNIQNRVDEMGAEIQWYTAQRTEVTLRVALRGEYQS